ncbi:carbon storage regulator [Spirochaetia bacterium]|nr:carbon storage regulator [Spirochaetia bacterium]GHU37505.1 carbon storage regulator [Spirochaetia bacterium]
MLILSRKANEKIMIGDDISLVIVEVRGDQVRIGVEAPKIVKVYRQEVYDAIKAENEAAAESTFRLSEGLRLEQLKER